MSEIEVKKLTKDYGHGRGIYDVSFEVKKGEVFGFLGPNGAGKSTTMRHLMGYSKPQSGNAYIQEKECFREHSCIMNQVGYLPGEVALPEGVDGKGFIRMMRGLRNHSQNDRVQELIKRFELKLSGDVRKLSIGEKRKLAIVAAFMNDPDVLLLDEPTSGLDPVMQEVFIEFVKEEKKRGKTILLSSHIFNEVEALCDRIAIIKDGKIISVVDAEEVKHFKRKTFDITFEDMEYFNHFKKEPFEIRDENPDHNQLSLIIENSQMNTFIHTIVNYGVSSFVERKQTLEEYFMHFYKNNRSFGGIADGRNN